MRHFCTYFDSNYLVRALALYLSIKANSGSTPFRFYILALDDKAKDILLQLPFPELTVFSLDDIEKHYPELLEAKANRSKIEYIFTLTPYLPLMLLDLYQDSIDRINYVDADMLFYDDLALVDAELEGSSVAITPHRFPKGKEYLAKHGIYNVGLISYRNDAHGRECLEWYRARCHEWCYDRVEGEKFADQGYLNHWPDLFTNVKVIDNPGVNLAPWNVEGHQLHVRNDKILVDGHPLLLFHFHGFHQHEDGSFHTNLNGNAAHQDSVCNVAVYPSYIQVLLQLQEQLKPIAPDLTLVKNKRYHGKKKEEAKAAPAPAVSPGKKRIMLVDTVYKGFTDWLYASQPGLADQDFAAQQQAFFDGCFHSAAAWKAPLERLGHDVLSVSADIPAMQIRWCLENNAHDALRLANDQVQVGGFGLSLPAKGPWFCPVVEEQIRQFRPDLLLIANLYKFDTAFLARVKDYYGIAIGQHAAKMPTVDVTGYDMMISSLPNQVDAFAAMGIDSHHLKLAWDPSYSLHIHPGAPKYDVSFVGAVSGDHHGRSDFLRQLSQYHQIDQFGDRFWSAEHLQGCQIRLHDPRWGATMYQTLSDSRITLNNHLDAAGPYANNLRLYEATGVRSFLLTDHKDNLGEIFEPGKEVETYASVEEARDKIRFYLDNESARQAIANAGYERVMKDHNYDIRAKELMQLLSA